MLPLMPMASVLEDPNLCISLRGGRVERRRKMGADYTSLEQQKSDFFEVLDYKCGVRSRNSGGYPEKGK